MSTMGHLRQIARVTIFGSRKNARNSQPFNVSRDIPSWAGKVVLVTGGAGGMGREIVMELARHARPARIYVADLPLPDEDSEQKLIKSISDEAYGEGSSSSAAAAAAGAPRSDIRFLELDLSSRQSTRQCAANFLAEETRLDVLVLNAGILKVTPGVTKDGHEQHFGINYVGHALFSNLLVPTMRQTAAEERKESGKDSARTRMVVVASEGYALAPKGGIAFDKIRTNCEDMSYLQRYGQSKLALIHLTRKLAQLHPEIEIAAVHPGRVVTGLGLSLAKESMIMRMMMPLSPLMSVNANVGARNALWAATSPGVVSGTYYEPVGVPDMEKTFKPAMDTELAARLWEWTEKELTAAKL